MANGISIVGSADTGLSLNQELSNRVSAGVALGDKVNVTGHPAFVLSLTGQANWTKGSAQGGIYTGALLPLGNYAFVNAGGLGEVTTEGKIEVAPRVSLATKFLAALYIPAILDFSVTSGNALEGGEEMAKNMRFGVGLVGGF